MTKPHSEEDKRHDDESDSKDLHEPVDWMTYTHQQLYDMLTKGVELGSAHEVKDGWAKLSSVLADVQTKLNTAIDNSDKGWEGESAEKARDGLRSVTTWASDTAEHAGSVAKAIDTEIKNVTDAINAMPPPPAPAPPPVPVPPPTPTPIGAWAVREDLMMQHDITGAQFGGITAQSPANPFANAPVIASGTVDTVVASDAAHRQAADVMAAFQRNSIAVDQTVPQLAPPTNPVNQNVGPGGASVPKTTGTPDGGTSATGAPVPVGSGGQTSNTRTSSSRGGSFGRVPTGGGGGGGSYSRTFMPPAASAGGAGGGGAGAPSSGGAAGVAGSAESVRSGAGAGAAAAAGNVNQTKAFQNPLQMGAAPMGAAPAAAGGREDEREYKHAAYLEEDDNVFGLDRKAAPPVIGQ
ncbi:PPE domain-containing protein [Lentzea tibetensis]|uniref:PPE domain-containing protein n=1 Tax=Lentzea tibetensis TaxID=2591470 RepID=A0A563EVL6_9PSEU|nr:PPE domain-containing protein [Lentzea tibetensis]TWP51568.1 PPE domain-containing protein [Lentzea tibetensis]